MTRIYLSLAAEDGTRTIGDDLAYTLPLQARDCVQGAPCETCGRTHDALWTIERRAYPSGLYWPFVWVNGQRLLFDGSTPTVLARLPRDARFVPSAEHARLWHEDNESHTFGGPNVAAALRAAIATANEAAS